MADSLENGRFMLCETCHGHGVQTIEAILRMQPGDEIDLVCPTCGGDSVRLILDHA